MRTIDKKREFKLYFEKSNLSFGVMVPTTDDSDDLDQKSPEQTLD